MEERKQEDADMFNVLQMIKQLFLGLFKSIIWLFETTFKKAFLLLGFMAVCIGIFLGLYFLQETYYKSEMYVSHTRLENDYCEGMINNLGISIDLSRENSVLAKTLDLTPKEALLVKSIAYEVVNEKMAKSYSDSAGMYLPFKVEVEVYNNSILPKLQTSILHYLESNEYAKRLKEIEKQSIAKIESRVISEIEEIDSLKHIVNTSIIPRGTGNGIILGEPINPVIVYDKAMKSYEKLMTLDKKKQLNDSFDIMVGFSENHKREGFTLLGCILNGILIGYLMGILFLLSKKAKLS